MDTGWLFPVSCPSLFARHTVEKPLVSFDWCELAGQMNVLLEQLHQFLHAHFNLLAEHRQFFYAPFNGNPRLKVLLKSFKNTVVRLHFFPKLLPNSPDCSHATANNLGSFGIVEASICQQVGDH